MSLLIRKLKHASSYYYEFVSHGIRYTGTIGKVGIIPRSLALQIERQKRVEIERGLLQPQSRKVVPKPTLDALMAMYVADRRPHWRQNTWKHHQGVWKQIGPMIGHLHVDQVTRATLIQLRDTLLTRLEPSTLNKWMQLPKTLMQYAIDLGHITHLPWGRVRQVPQTRAHVHLLLPHEEARLLELCPVPRLASVILLALYAGLRRGECLGLEWRDVDLRRRTLSIRAEVSKTHRARILPLCETALRALRAVQPGLRQPSHLMGGSVFGYRNFDKTFKALVRRSGMPTYKFHWLRHTFSSRLQAAGCDIVTVQAFLGHTSLDTTWIYSHLVPGHARESIGLLDAPNQRESPADRVR